MNLFLDGFRWFVLFSLKQYQNFVGYSVDVTLPGTKWCGPGNVSSGYDDLGALRATDYCCRDHDSCPAYILAGSADYGLVNEDPYTRSLCRCDEKFYACLHLVNSTFADNIAAGFVGYVYFTFLQDRCFEPISNSTTYTANSTSAHSTQYQWKVMPSF